MERERERQNGFFREKNNWRERENCEEKGVVRRGWNMKGVKSVMVKE